MSEISIGYKFGKRTVVSGPEKVRKAKRNVLMALCECECGRRDMVRLCAIKSGRSGSCKHCRPQTLNSHLIKIPQHKTKPIHGGSLKINGKYVEKEYAIWKSMRGRCNNPKNKDYGLYGGRGISVCERWNDYSNFREDMGSRPSKRHSLDRFPDNNGNYEPSNCRWATQSQQCRNKKSNKNYFYKGKNRCIAEISEITGFSYRFLYYRLVVSEMSLSETLEKPRRLVKRASA